VPEGDTVYLAAKRLHDALAGRVLTTTDFRVPQLATTDLTGRRVLDVVSRGKHLLTRIDGDVTLHTHLRMDGSWRLFRNGTAWSGGPRHEVRIVLANDDWQAVGYRMPVIDLLRTSDEHTVVGHLGPDLLGPVWDADEALRRLRERPDRQIGPALLDQRNLAGIGNLYKSETLFLSGVNPWTHVADVADLAGVVGRARRLLVANKDHWHQSTTGSTFRGQENWVFERAGKPCRRCRTAIRRAVQPEPGLETQERITYWCPFCQPRPD
jgi:endonuclease-8